MSPTISAAPSAAPSKTPAPPRRPIHLPRLPASGFVVGDRHGVTFVGADGAVLHRIDHLRIAGSLGSPGTWFGRGRDYYKLDVANRRLRPADKTIAAKINDEIAPRGLPPPPGARVNGRIAGRWRFAIEAPNGDALLAQWSGECEIPVAYFVTAGETPRIVTGEAEISDAPESLALGWVGDRAAVELPKGLCAGGTDVPGVYLFSAPGAGDLLYRIPGDASVEMWGPGGL